MCGEQTEHKKKSSDIRKVKERRKNSELKLKQPFKPSNTSFIFHFNRIKIKQREIIHHQYRFLINPVYKDEILSLLFDILQSSTESEIGIDKYMKIM